MHYSGRNRAAIDLPDDICGPCRCGVVSQAVEHRDFGQSAAQRDTSMNLCQSRAAPDGGVIEIDLWGDPGDSAWS